MRTSVTFRPLVPAGTRWLNRLRSPASNALAPVPSMAVRKIPSCDAVSTLNSRVVAEASSPQPAEGSIRNCGDVDRPRQLGRTRVGVPAFGLPGYAPMG